MATAQLKSSKLILSGARPATLGASTLACTHMKSSATFDTCSRNRENITCLVLADHVRPFPPFSYGHLKAT
jgi:hypothetical protein